MNRVYALKSPSIELGLKRLDPQRTRLPGRGIFDMLLACVIEIDKAQFCADCVAFAKGHPLRRILRQRIVGRAALIVRARCFSTEAEMRVDGHGRDAFFVKQMRQHKK